jgi:hypothetical protein
MDFDSKHWEKNYYSFTKSTLQEIEKFLRNWFKIPDDFDIWGYTNFDKFFNSNPFTYFIVYPTFWRLCLSSNSEARGGWIFLKF